MVGCVMGRTPPLVYVLVDEDMRGTSRRNNGWVGKEGREVTGVGGRPEDEETVWEIIHK